MVAFFRNVYSLSLGELLHSHEFKYHLYAGGSQVYISSQDCSSGFQPRTSLPTLALLPGSPTDISNSIFPKQKGWYGSPYMTWSCLLFQVHLKFLFSSFTHWDPVDSWIMPSIFLLQGFGTCCFLCRDCSLMVSLPIRYEASLTTHKTRPTLKFSIIVPYL